MSHAASLAGRVALVTGVSRRQGIAWTIARRLADLGVSVHATGFRAHDAEMPWGADEGDLGIEVADLDLAELGAPEQAVDATVERFGAIDMVLAVHARSSSQSLLDVTAQELDRSFAANVRSVVLLARRFAECHDPARPGGRMIWFTSGQHLGPMPSELPYIVAKGALHQMTASVASALSDRGIVANCINPGPVNTGYADAEIEAIVAKRFPGGRWGTPDDVANLVEFLVSDAGGWINGQVLNSEGGFRRSG